MDNKPTGREPGSEVPGGAETRPIFTKPGRIRRCRSFLTIDRDDFKLDYAPASATVTPGGTYSVTVRGISGSLIREGISTLTVTAATPETPVSESFDRSDSTNLGSGWNEYLADFGIRGNEVSNLDAAGQEAKHVSLRETGGCETGVLPFFSGKILLLAGKRSMNRLRGVCRFLLRSEAVKAYDSLKGSEGPKPLALSVSRLITPPGFDPRSFSALPPPVPGHIHIALAACRSVYLSCR